MGAPIANHNAVTRWTAEMDARLEALIAEQNSFTEAARIIGREFGLQITRNAAIGRAHRRGVHSDQDKLARLRRIKRDLREAKKAARVTSRAAKHEAGSAASKLLNFIRNAGRVPPGHQYDRLRCAEIEPLHLSLEDLAPASCRYPYGGWPSEAPITYCGHERMEGSSYCAGHDVLCHGRGTTSERRAHWLS